MIGEFVAGIDPGHTGWQCVLRAEGRTQSPVFSPSPWSEGDGWRERDAVTMARAWREQGVGLVVLERQHVFGRGKQGTKGAFEKGYAYAMWRTALFAAGYLEREQDDPPPPGVHFSCPMPMRWKSHMGCAGAEGDRKQALALIVGAAMKLHPGVDFRVNERARTPSADKGAAVLLADYARALWTPAGVR